MGGEDGGDSGESKCDGMAVETGTKTTTVLVLREAQLVFAVCSSELFDCREVRSQVLQVGLRQEINAYMYVCAHISMFIFICVGEMLENIMTNDRGVRK